MAITVKATGSATLTRTLNGANSGVWYVSLFDSSGTPTSTANGDWVFVAMHDNRNNTSYNNTASTVVSGYVAVSGTFSWPNIVNLQTSGTTPAPLSLIDAGTDNSGWFGSIAQKASPGLWATNVLTTTTKSNSIRITHSGYNNTSTTTAVTAILVAGLPSPSSANTVNISGVLGYRSKYVSSQGLVDGSSNANNIQRKAAVVSNAFTILDLSSGTNVSTSFNSQGEFWVQPTWVSSTTVPYGFAQPFGTPLVVDENNWVNDSITGVGDTKGRIFCLSSTLAASGLVMINGQYGDCWVQYTSIYIDPTSAFLVLSGCNLAQGPAWNVTPNTALSGMILQHNSNYILQGFPTPAANGYGLSTFPNWSTSFNGGLSSQAITGGSNAGTLILLAGTVAGSGTSLPAVTTPFFGYGFENFSNSGGSLYTFASSPKTQSRVGVADTVKTIASSKSYSKILRVLRVPLEVVRRTVSGVRSSTILNIPIVKTIRSIVRPRTSNVLQVESNTTYKFINRLKNTVGTSIIIAGVVKSVSRVKKTIITTTNLVSNSRIVSAFRRTIVNSIRIVSTTKFASKIKNFRVLRLNLGKVNKKARRFRFPTSLQIRFSSVAKRKTAIRTAVVLQPAAATITKSRQVNRKTVITTTYEIGTSRFKYVIKTAIVAAVANVKYGLSAAFNIRHLANSFLSIPFSLINSFTQANNEDEVGNFTEAFDNVPETVTEPDEEYGEDVYPTMT